MARPIPRSRSRSQAAASEPEGPKATAASEPEGPQATASRAESSRARARARAAAGGEAAARHPGAQQPAGPAPRSHARIEEGRCPAVIFVTVAARASEDRGEEAQEKDRAGASELDSEREEVVVLRFHGGTVVSSQHKRKLRCLELCPVNDQLVVTSALDGLVTLWQVQPKGPSGSLLSTTDGFSPKHRWPEDVAWHPDGDTIFAVYSADGGDFQVSMINLNISGQKKVTFLPAKPHTKGNINNINFMPWSESDACFVSCDWWK